MKVLAVLQNQWFHDPENVKKILVRTPAARRRIITYSLFAGCRTGRVLKEVFGEDCPRRFIWEEASPEIGGHASSAFQADMFHLSKAINEHAPDLVLAFGKIAADALRKLVPEEKLIVGPHPTARGPDTMHKLRIMRADLNLRTASTNAAREEKE